MVHLLSKTTGLLKIANKPHFQQLSKMSNNISTPKELRIPVPWGHIAAKQWGPPDGQPASTNLLGLHGWQDNACTFDGLAPLLPPHVRFVAVDTIGHGLSSHLPRGMSYYFVDSVPMIRRVVDYLQWSEFSIIGHSAGAGSATLFGSICPTRVKKVICLDGLVPMPTKAENQPGFTMTGLDQLMRLEATEKEPMPVYSFDEAVTRYMNALNSKILEKSARTLMTRGTSAVGKNTVQYTRDKRVTIRSLLSFTPEQLLSFLNNFKKDMLVILVIDGIFYNDKIRALLEILKKNCSKFRYAEVEGHHHVHLDYPERVAPIVNAFLEEL